LLHGIVRFDIRESLLSVVACHKHSAGEGEALGRC
jgi:hypothetical protein